MAVDPSVLTVFAVLGFITGLVLQIILVVIAFRATVAHERIAAALERRP